MFITYMYSNDCFFASYSLPVKLFSCCCIVQSLTGTDYYVAFEVHVVMSLKQNEVFYWATEKSVMS